MKSYCVKGSHLEQAKRCVDGKLGAGTFAKLAAQAGAVGSWEKITVSAWYDVYVLHRVLEIAVREIGTSMVAFTTEIARQNALVDLTGIYRMFLRVAQPVRMLYFTPQLWRNYVGFAEARARRNEPGLFVASVSHVPEVLVDWCCGSSLGFLPTGIQLAGGLVHKAEITESVLFGDESTVEITVDYRMT